MVPTRDPKVIEEIFQKLFDRLFADESLMQNLMGINRVVMIKYDRPEVVIYLDFNDGGSRVLFKAEGRMNPHATLEMDWETAHKLWSGTLDLIPALLSERVRVAGEVEQLVQLKSMYGKATEIYKEIIDSLA
jgi:putative sterol carrier protein